MEEEGEEEEQEKPGEDEDAEHADNADAAKEHGGAYDGTRSVRRSATRG